MNHQPGQNTLNMDYLQAKQSKEHIFGGEKPIFEPNTVFSEPTLAVDRNGKMWWINPEAMIIRPA